MKLTRLRYRSIPPQGVRIRRSDGTTVPCGVLRDPDGDKDGCAMWVAVPMERYEPGDGDAILAGVLPGKTMLSVRFREPGGD